MDKAPAIGDRGQPNEPPKDKKEKTHDYEDKKRRRKRCTHKKEVDTVLQTAIKRYGNAKGSFAKCSGCGRRWRWTQEEWKTNDGDAPKTDSCRAK